jgi:hypothetical protein
MLIDAHADCDTRRDVPFVCSSTHALQHQNNTGNGRVLSDQNNNGEALNGSQKACDEDRMNSSTLAELLQSRGLRAVSKLPFGLDFQSGVEEKFCDTTQGR